MYLGKLPQIVLFFRYFAGPFLTPKAHGPVFLGYCTDLNFFQGEQILWSWGKFPSGVLAWSYVRSVSDLTTSSEKSGVSSKLLHTSYATGLEKSAPAAG